MMPSCHRRAGDDCKNGRWSALLAGQPGFGRAVREVLEVVDQVRLVEITMLQCKLRPVRCARQALQGGIGRPKAADAGKQLGADAGVTHSIVPPDYRRAACPGYARSVQWRGPSCPAQMAAGPCAGAAAGD